MLLLDALLEVAVLAAACAVAADIDSLLTISPRTCKRPPYLMGPPVCSKRLETINDLVALQAALGLPVEVGAAWRDSPGLANVKLPLSLGGGTHANQTCRRTQRVAGAGAGGSTQARYRYRTDG